MAYLDSISVSIKLNSIEYPVIPDLSGLIQMYPLLCCVSLHPANIK